MFSSELLLRSRELISPLLLANLNAATGRRRVGLRERSPYSSLAYVAPVLFRNGRVVQPDLNLMKGTITHTSSRVFSNLLKGDIPRTRAEANVPGGSENHPYLCGL